MKTTIRISVLALCLFLVSGALCACGGSSVISEPPAEAPAGAIDSEINQMLVDGQHIFLMSTVGDFIRQFDALEGYKIVVNAGNVDHSYSVAELSDSSSELYKETCILWGQKVWINNAAGECFATIVSDSVEGELLMDCEIKSYDFDYGSVYVKGKAYAIGSECMEEIEALGMEADHIDKHTMGARVYNIDGELDTCYFYHDNTGKILKGIYLSD